MTSYPDLFAALAAPFAADEVKVLAVKGRQMPYVTARTVMNRLDTVLGPERWWDDYVPGEHSVLCRLTIQLPDGSTLTKADAGGYAGMSDEGDDDKSGYSDAFKRAAVKFGVGRYLYRDGVPHYETGPPPVVTVPGHAAVEPPARTPARALPAPAVEPPAERGPVVVNGHRQDPPAPAGARGRHEWAGAGNAAGRGDQPKDQAPRSGKALFAWVKDQEQRYGVGLLKYLNNWAKLQEFPLRMVDWGREQVDLGYAEACRKLSTIPGDAAEAAS